MACVSKEYESKTKIGKGGMITTNNVFIGLELENFYLVGGWGGDNN